MSFPDPYPAEDWPAAAAEVAGLEFDWFARDLNGQLGMFTSAGRGFVPGCVFSLSADPYNGVITALAARATAPAIQLFTGYGGYDDWCQLAEHGLFAYDFQDVHRTAAAARHGYDLRYKPSIPATVRDLPASSVQYLPLLPTVFGTADLIPLALLREL